MFSIYSRRQEDIAKTGSHPSLICQGALNLHNFPQSASDQPATDASQVYWGGPDLPERRLRDLLEERIHATPSGGEILWVTYYFRDEGLATALLQASNRGVRVRVAMEGDPRTGDINKRVRALLEGADGLGRGLRSLKHLIPDNRFLRLCRLHEKLYYFSHPLPYALVGTFNPSGNSSEDPAVLHKIGDQDRGHNMLVEICETTLIAGLYAHAEQLFAGHHGPWERFLPRLNMVLTSGNTRVLFFPRSQWSAFDALFDVLGPGSRLRMAVSHLNDRGICKRLFGLARQGVKIEIIAHDTKRRVPSWVEQQMLENGIIFNRYVHPEGLPMHNKFMLFETPGKRISAFGSMNLSVRSLRANHELLVVSEELPLYQEIEKRWRSMLKEISEWAKES